MSTTLTSPKVTLNVQATLSTGAAPAPTTSTVSLQAGRTPAVGSSSGQVQYVYAAALTVTSGTPLLIDLTSLTDPVGGAINFAAVTDLAIINGSSTTGQDLTIGGASSNPFITSDPITVQAGGYFAVAGPVGLTVDSTHKILQITVAAGTAVPFQIVIMGR